MKKFFFQLRQALSEIIVTVTYGKKEYYFLEFRIKGTDYVWEIKVISMGDKDNWLLEGGFEYKQCADVFIQMQESLGFNPKGQWRLELLQDATLSPYEAPKGQDPYKWTFPIRQNLYFFATLYFNLRKQS